MHYTSNLGLVQYDKEDKFRITETTDSLNANMEIIDEQIVSKMKKPTNVGTQGQVLRNDGSGGSEWGNAATSEEISGAVTEWLEDNVPTGTTVAIVKNLYTEDAAADSKTVGDAVNSIDRDVEVNASDIMKLQLELTQSRIRLPIAWEQGSISNAGVDAPDTTRIRSPYIYIGDLNSVDITPESGYMVSWLTYNDSKVVTSVQDWTASSGNVAYSPGAVYIRVVLRKTDGTSPIVVSDGTNLRVFGNVKIQSQISTTNTNLSRLRNSIAEAFSTSKAYAVGDYVMYEYRLYRFTTAHSAGAWNSAHVSEVILVDDIVDNKIQVVGERLVIS